MTPSKIVADWAHTEITTLPDLATPCGHHHDLKTHHGYRFGALLPNGKRRLIPPDDPDPPRPVATGPPLTVRPDPTGTGPTHPINPDCSTAGE